MASLVDVARLKFAGMPRECVRQVIVATGAHKEILDAFDAAADFANMRPRELAFAMRFFLQGANLRGADFVGCDLPNTNAADANLSGAKMIRASLDGSDFSHANLSGASLRGAFLDRVNFCGANLAGADLSNAARIRTAVFTGAQYDAETVWPDKFDPIKAGAIFTKGVKNE